MRRWMVACVLGAALVVDGHVRDAAADESTERAKRQLARAFAGWDLPREEHALELSLRSVVEAGAVRRWAMHPQALDIPADTEGLPPPSEPMRIEAWVRGGESALLHAAPAPLLAWYGGPGGTWMRAADPPDPKVRYPVELVGGHTVFGRPIGVGWAYGQGPDLPTLELDLAATLDLAGLRTWILSARGLRRTDRARGGTQLHATARASNTPEGLEWGAVRSVELTIELDAADRLLSLILQVDRSPPSGVRLVVPNRGRADTRIERGPLPRWRRSYPRAPLSDPDAVVPRTNRARGQLAAGNAPQPAVELVLEADDSDFAPRERLTLELRPRSAPTSRLLELFLARRRS